MRKTARWLLLLFIFTIPWEYSLDLGAPWGNIARVAGLAVLIATVLAILQAGGMRKPCLQQWLTAALFLWFCCSLFWSIAPEVTAVKLRGYFQEMMLVWLVWELLDNPADFRNLLRAWLAGSWVLVLLTVADFAMHDPASSEQIRFVAAGQDPNDVARFIDLGLPVAALLLDGRERWPGKLLASLYIPLGFGSVLLTASRSGFVVAVITLAGCSVILSRRNAKALLAGSLVLPAIAGLIWLAAPHETLLRLRTIAEQLQNADLNQRFNIWTAGWRAFVTAPICGHGAGSFVTAAGLATEDTAHNTILSTLIEGGLIALALAGAIVVCSVKAILATKGPLRTGLVTLLAALFVASLAGTVGESRTTWLLLATIAVTERMAEGLPKELEDTFSDPVPMNATAPAASLS